MNAIQIDRENKLEARIAELEAQLAEASTHKDVWRDKWENAIERAEKAEAEAVKLRAQLVEAKEKLERSWPGREIARLKGELEIAWKQVEAVERLVERLDKAEAERDRLNERSAHWQEEYRDATSRYQRMIEERNGLRAALEEIQRRPCGDKNCNASEIATAAINPGAPVGEESETTK